MPDAPRSTSSAAGSGSRTRDDDGQSASAFAAFSLLLVGAAAAMFLAGGAEQGSLGVFLLFAGTALVVCPPRAPVEWSLWLVAAAVGLCSAGALLPARFFHVLAWRQGLASVPDLPLPDTVSAAPAQTGFWLAVLAVTVLIGLYTLTQPVRSRGLLTLALAGGGVCGLYAALSIFARVSGWHYPFSSDATFGFFPNRNHTATLLITGSLVSIGLLGVAFRNRRWLAADWAVATLTLCAAGLLFFSPSRAGVVFLVVGLLIWVMGLSGGQRGRPLLLAVVLVVLTSGGLFLFLQSAARDRLLGVQPTTPAATRFPANNDTNGDDRTHIYRDTLDMIRDAPLTGTGLGTFSLVYPFYRHALVTSTTVLHPESDWLMVAAETGLPALACLALLGFLVLRRWRPAREHPYWPLRWGFLVAAVAGLLHGLVDVPVHRVALGWWLLVMAGLALQPGRGPSGESRAARVARRATHGVFVLGGLLALGLGVALVRAEWFGAPPLPPYVADRAEADLAKAIRGGDMDAAFAQAQAAVRASPLDAELYYRFGAIGLQIVDAEPEVDRAFRIERLLNWYAAEIPRTQGIAWLGDDPARAVHLFTESLIRQERLLHTDPRLYQNLAGFWYQLVQQARLSDIQGLMWETSVSRGPILILAWLDAANADVVKGHLPGLAADPRFLDGLDPAQRQQFLALWQQKGDPAALQSFRETHGPAWLAGKPPGG